MVCTLRYYMSDQRSPFGVPPSFSNANNNPWNRSLLNKFCRRFYWDVNGLYEWSSQRRVAIDNGCQKFRAVVCHLYAVPEYRAAWSTINPERLRDLVQILTDLWIPDALVYTEYFLKNPPRLYGSNPSFAPLLGSDTTATCLVHGSHKHRLCSRLRYGSCGATGDNRKKFN
ncbi:hypothetical protein L218DRAFT_1082213 [Marasmius fiardii PR-910]|nr:hypothetical protein L218DRAFT_1082213 [Marasmius fiardii PR-910]